MRQNLGWAIGYNALALPIAAGVFMPSFGLMLRPEIAALTMSGSSFIVAANALALKRLRLPAQESADPQSGVPGAAASGDGRTTAQAPPASRAVNAQRRSGPQETIV
jgi:Cu2+-exporting ATPase